MKTLIETSGKEIIATVYTSQKLDENHDPIWVEKENNIGLCVNKVHSFKWYEPTSDGYLAVSLTAAEVMTLARYIRDQAKIETSKFMD